MGKSVQHKPEILLFQAGDGTIRLEVRMAGDTVWLTQAQMAELFQTTKQNISLHIRNIFAEQELRESSVVKEFLTTAADEKNYQTLYYNLDIKSVNPELKDLGAQVQMLKQIQHHPIES